MATLLHPNGFIQHDLDGGARLHIWADDLPIAQVTRSPIHDHTFRFRSRVVMGRLLNETYTISFVDDEATHHVWFSNENGLLIPSGYNVIARPNHMEVYGVGETYEYGGPNQFHDTRGARGMVTATIMHKLEIDLARAPQVLVPIDTLADNDFRRTQYGAETLMPWVREVMEYMEEHNA